MSPQPFLVRLEEAIGPLWTLPLYIIALTLLLANSNPRAFFSDGLIQLALLPVMILVRIFERRTETLTLSLSQTVESVGLFCLALVATFSLIANADAPTFEYWLFGFAVPIALFFLVRRPAIPAETVRTIIVLYLIGGAITFMRGLVVFYQQWGIPDITTVIMARFDNVRMEPYGAVTFGSLAGPAAICAVAVPLCAFYLAYGRLSLRLKVLCSVILAIFLANAFIIQIRALLLILLLMGFLMLLRYSIAAVGISLAAAGAAFVVLVNTPGPVALLLVRLQTAATANSDSDGSVYARLDSMRIGWRLMMDHWQFGIGPGNAATQNAFTAAHQFWINQGSELGAFGMVLWIVLSLIWMGRFLYDYLILRGEPLPIILQAGPFFYWVFAVISNAGISAGYRNPWIASVLFFLALAASKIDYDGEMQRDRGSPTIGGKSP